MTTKTTYVRAECPTCHGKHIVDGRLCQNPECRGTGFVLAEKPKPIFSERIDRAIENLGWGIIGGAVFYFGIHLLLAAARIWRG